MDTARENGSKRVEMTNKRSFGPYVSFLKFPFFFFDTNLMIHSYISLRFEIWLGGQGLETLMSQALYIYIDVYCQR